MEQFFQATRVSKEERVMVTAMYLTGDAKLWWRSQLESDLSAGRPKINTWEIMRKELTNQFLPGNTAWVARESLKKLKQMGSVREYVREFSSLLDRKSVV